MTALNKATGSLAAACVRGGLRVVGRRVAKRDAGWLECPMGPPGNIGAQFYTYLAEREHLQIRPAPDAGLLPDFDALGSSSFDPAQVHPEIRHFYEHTSCYHLEAWSEASMLTKPALLAMTRLLSRHMDQLNFPLSSLELAGGMTSEVLPMVDASGTCVYTGWLRRFAAGERVLYTGLYSVGQPAGHPEPCVKVSFPVPNGSSTVFLRPEAQPDGSFKLISSGTGFGGTGFYRMLEVSDEHWRVRYFRSLRETFHVYLNRQGTLRTEHVVRFLGFTPLRLHYKMERVAPQPGPYPAGAATAMS